jgi:hypothetical protein
MTGVTTALATCWTALGRRQANQFARAFTATTTPTPKRPSQAPTGRLSSAPTTMWFMFRASPVSNTSATCTTRKRTKAHMTRKWSERPTCRLPGRLGYHLKRFVSAGDIEGPVRMARGARPNTTAK